MLPIESKRDRTEVVILEEHERTPCVCVLVRCGKTLDEDVACTVDVVVDKQVARGTVEGVVGQRQCVFYCPTCLARVLFSHSRETCPRDLTFEGQTLVKGLMRAHNQVFVHPAVPAHAYQFSTFEWWWYDVFVR